jgi:alcohol dehydrogenase class IV
MRFEFATAARIVFGRGTLSEIGPLATEMGRRVLVVTGGAGGRAAPRPAAPAAQGLAWTTFAVSGEPTLELVRRGLAQALRSDSDIIIGFGGGSALDTAKAIAGLLTNGGDPLDYVEVIGRGQPLARPAAPLIAIPTTAGTGSEVTRNAVLASPEHGVKVSLRSPFLLPRLALVDPELTYSLPPAVTASTGLDALTQLIEPFVSLRANPLTDLLCRQGMALVARSLRRAYEQGGDPVAREEMSLASLFSGMALANAGLGAVHGLAAAIGGPFPAPHGAVCARLLPPVMAANVRALRERAPRSEALARYDEIARVLTGNPQARADDGVAWVKELVQGLAIPPLSTYGIQPAHLAGLVEKAMAASSMKGNPVQLSAAELGGILAQV